MAHHGNINMQELALIKPAPKIPTNSFLSHMDTGFVDVYGNPLTTTGSPVLSTTTKKFGAASMQWNANATSTITNGISLPTDFTIDFWGYKTANAASYYLAAYCLTPNTQFVLDRSAAGSIGIYYDGTWRASAGGLFTTNQWNHFAWVRKDKTLMAFINGVMRLNATVTNLLSLKINHLIGAPSYSFGFVGYVDEVAIAPRAKWTADFTPPTEAYTA